MFSESLPARATDVSGHVYIYNTKMSETKRQKSNDLQPGKNIWSTLKSWFGNVLDEGTIFFCPWPLSNEQLEFHLVEGDVKKVGKRKATVLYSAMSDVEVILDKKEISMQSHNFFDHDEFPTGAVVVKTQNDLDYVAGVAPCRPKINRECSHAHELNSSYCVNCYQLQYNTFIEREHHLKKRLDTLYEESLMYKRSGLEHIPETTLIDQFPEVIKVCVHDRTDIAASQKMIWKKTDKCLLHGSVSNLKYVILGKTSRA